MKKLLIVALVLAAVTKGHAQAVSIDKPFHPLPSATARHIADVTSWGTALVPVVIDTVDAWKSPHRKDALYAEAERVAIVYGATFGVKYLVRRVRPCAPACGSDDPDTSFWSGHTAIAFSAVHGKHASIELPFAVTTGGLRVMAGKHWLTDVLAGAAAGYAASFIRQPIDNNVFFSPTAKVQR